MPQTLRKTSRRTLWLAALALVIGTYLVLGATLGTSENSPLAGSVWRFGALTVGVLLALGGLGMIVGAVIRRRH